MEPSIQDLTMAISAEFDARNVERLATGVVAANAGMVHGD